MELERYSDPSVVPALRDALSDEEVRFFAARSLGVLRDLYAVPELIELYLENDNESYRRTGIEILILLSDDDFGFDPSANSSSRRKSVDSWWDWWESIRASVGR